MEINGLKLAKTPEVIGEYHPVGRHKIYNEKTGNVVVRTIERGVNEN